MVEDMKILKAHFDSCFDKIDKFNNDKDAKVLDLTEEEMKVVAITMQMASAFPKDRATRYYAKKVEKSIKKMEKNIHNFLRELI